MPRVVFTKNLQRRVPCPPVDAKGSTVCDVLGNVFAENPRLRGYIVDEHGALRKHMTVFVNNDQITMTLRHDTSVSRRVTQEARRNAG